MKHLALMVAVVLLCGTAKSQEWVERSPSDSTLNVRDLGGEPEEFWTFKEQRYGATFHCHYGYWGWDAPMKTRIEADYCRSDDTSSWGENAGGYSDDYKDTDQFLTQFEETRVANSREKAKEGPTIETVIGDIVVHVFDVNKDRSYARFRECMGFHTVWDRGSGNMRSLYGKSLMLYACGNDGALMSETKLTKLLSGFSIEGEFEALIED